MASDDSFYRPPESDLERAPETRSGSIESAIAGDFALEIGSVVSEAWSLLKGTKRVILLGYAISYLVTGLANAAQVAIDGPEPDGISAFGFLVSFGGTIAVWPITAGIMVFAVKRASGDRTTSFEELFAYYPIFMPIVALFILQIVLTMLGFILLVLPGIYLSVAYFMALPLLAERKLGIWEALETSRKALTRCWFRILGLAVLIGLAILVGGVLSLGIGLIWLIPFGTLCFGVAYREIFGAAEVVS